jgi:hypothetical protein
MGVNLKYGTVGATGGGFSAQPGTLQPAFDERSAEPKWNYQSRSPKTWKDRNCWYSLWSFGCRTGMGGSGGGSDGEGPNGMNHPDLFEPFSCDGEGTQTKRFIKGTCLDNNLVPISGCIVQGFVTATDAFVGEVTSREDGSYDLGTETIPGVAHYLVAYKPGSPDIGGTTINTLTSTNVDGT